MIRALLVATLALSAAANAAADASVMSGALIEALSAVEKPELGGVFAYVGEQNAPRAFADMIARDPAAAKKYAGKLKDDIKVAEGVTAWDHEVCANLVTYYSGNAPGVHRPKEKVVKTFNQAVLSPVKDLQDIVSRRKK